MSPADLQILLLAQARALISPAMVERLVTAAAASGTPAAELLVSEGGLHPDVVMDLRRTLEANAVAPITAVASPHSLTHFQASVHTRHSDPAITGSENQDPRPPTAPSPAASSPPPLPTAAKLGKYEILGELGRGGMGIVHRAYDPELRREVALKTLLSDGKVDPEAVQRFLREARMVAALEHPGIVPIHEVGEIDGVPYFAMVYVKGLALHQTLKTGACLGMRERARLVHDVADAVAHAHARGVIHRDLKPSNILIDAAGKVHVLDFGLARRVSEHSRLTTTGQLLGTPDYMSPEQIDGDTEHMGPPTDVYALGAILYEVLTGRTPFASPSVKEVFAKSIFQDPRPPRELDPVIPTDLETICLKALAKEPAGRYPTAREFADDLGRFLAGESIAGRRESHSHRVARWARQHRGWVGVVLGLVTLAAIAVGWGMRAQRGAGRESAAAQAKVRTILDRIGQAVDRLEDHVFRVELSPAARRVLAEQPLELLDGLIAEDPDFGAAYSYRGKVKLLLDPRGVAAAEADYDEGCARSPEQAAVWALRGMYALDRYAASRGIPDVSMGTSGVEFGPVTAESADETRWRAQGLADLARLDQITPDSPGCDEATARMGRAQAALYRGGPEDLQMVEDLLTAVDHPRAWRMRGIACYLQKRFDDSAQALRRTLTAWPLDGFAWNARGLALLGVAHQRASRGEDPRSTCTDAIAELTETLQSNPGHSVAYNLRGDFHALLGSAEMARGLDARASFERALADLGAALQGLPDCTSIYSSRGATCILLGEAEASRGLDPQASYQKALADFNEALRRAPESAPLYGSRGSAHLQLGHAEAARGVDPRESYRRAIADCDAALRRRPESTSALLTRGIAAMDFGTAEARRGQDPRDWYAKSLADLDAVLQNDPNNAEAFNSRGNAHACLGKVEAEQGRDPLPSYRRALADYSEALRHNPTSSMIHNNRGNAHARLGKTLAAGGLDPREAFALALSDYGEALRLRPDDADVCGNRATLYTDLGDAEGARGSDPREWYGKALADFGEALRRNPELVAAYRNRGVATLKLGEAQAARGLEAQESYGKAIADFGEALRRDPGDANAYNSRGNAHVALADLTRARGQDARAGYERGLSDFTEALRHEPNLVHALANRGRVHQHLGKIQASSGQDPHGAYTQALADLDAALRCNPEYVLAYNTRGNVYVSLGEAAASRGTDPREWFEKAIGEFAEVLRRNPEDATVLVNRGLTYKHLATAETARGLDPRETLGKALADGEAAIRRNPELVIAYLNRAATWSDLGVANARRGEDPRPCYAKALADLSAALQRNPELGSAFINRGMVYYNLGSMEAAGGAAAREWYVKALADFNRALQLNPESTVGFINRGNAHARLGQGAAAPGQDPHESLRNAEADYRSALQRHDLRAYFHLGILYRAQGRFDDAITAFEAAARALPGLAASARAQIEEVRKLRAPSDPDGTPAPPWVREFALAREALQGGNYSAAGAHYEQALGVLENAWQDLPAADRARRLADPALIDKRLDAHYNLACILALRSAGRENPQAAAREVRPDEAARARDAAFTHLEAAVQLGWSNVDHLQADGDLVPLHADDRWPALLARVRAPGK